MNDDSLSQNPVTLWIEELRAADQTAATKLWRHFFDRLREKALSKLRSDTLRVYDEEDAALSAFNSFCKGIAAGRFPDLQDRNSLSALLLAITGRKVSQRHRYDQRNRRDIRRTMNASIFDGGYEQSGTPGIQQLESREPNPEFVAAFTETCENFLGNFEDSKMREIATMRIEGYTDIEIASQLKCARSTVQRRLEIIRRKCVLLASMEE